MSTVRRTRGIYSSPTPRGPNGERLCRNCHAVLAKSRRNNCSAECSENWMIRTSPSHARFRVWQRDKGVCASCGVDTVAQAAPHGNGSPRKNCARNTGDLWQMDHVVPVIEGGGECGLDNLRTLCIACHKAETAALAKRRADARDAEALQILETPLSFGKPPDKAVRTRLARIFQQQSATSQTQPDLFGVPA